MPSFGKSPPKKKTIASRLLGLSGSVRKHVGSVGKNLHRTFFGEFPEDRVARARAKRAFLNARANNNRNAASLARKEVNAVNVLSQMLTAKNLTLLRKMGRHRHRKPPPR
jgi:hypothetical protein